MSPQTPIHPLGWTKQQFVGAPSTLCTGCGHDSITSHLISALYQSGLSPYKVAKLSGIGCSSKTPAYFLNQAHGFNSIHGRMAPVAIGAKVANRELEVLGISGDGDTASIGLGGFSHLLRRNLSMLYVVENNGVYGLTKGQFSATADAESQHKSGESNPYSAIDLCSLAIDLGCTFVARSFSGDAKQLVPLIQAGLRHKGTALIDVISPCVTFANHEGSTKSFKYVREHRVMLQELGFIAKAEEINVDYQEGSEQLVELHDGSFLRLRKLDSREHNIQSAPDAIRLLHEARQRQEVLTGLFYLNPARATLEETLNLSQTPLAHLQEKELRPPPEAFAKLLQAFR